MNIWRRLPIAPALWLALFSISAFIGALISYDSTLAWQRFALIAFGIAVFAVFAWMPVNAQVLRIVFAGLPILIIVYFALTNDWNARVGKVAWLDPVLSWLTTWQPNISAYRIDSNSLGGILAALAPLQIAALFGERANRRMAIGVVLIGITAFGLLLSESRGAWVALAMVAWAYAVWHLVGLVTSSSQTRTAIWISAMVIVSIIGAILVFATPLGNALISGRSDRWFVWSNSLALVSDYPFTGIGLGAFTMAYSSYALLVHVPHTIHAHNLFLDLWLEQGILGLIAFVGLMIASARNGRGTMWRVAALAGVGAVLLHGLLDDPFYGYGGNAIPFLFIPLGMLARGDSSQKNPATAVSSNPRVAMVVASVTVIASVVEMLMPTTRAMWVVNLGTLAQTRAELAIYHWPQTSFQDELRRSGKVDLQPAINFYQQALALDRHNVTANRRLGQIALSQERYDDARQFLSVAYESAPNQLATRVMLGEVDAVSNDANQARVMWSGLDLSAGQLMVRHWWYESLGDGERLKRFEWATRELGK